MSLKEKIRNDLAQSPESLEKLLQNAGKMAEHLRRVDAYRQAKQIFMSPAPLLGQMRINALLDGKELIMPAPALVDGFYLCRPYTIPHKDLAYAVSFKGLPKFGKKLDMDEISELEIDILVTDAVALDQQGGRLGDGDGFFDLAVAILNNLQALSGQVSALAVVGKDQFVEGNLPLDPWDVNVNSVIIPSGKKELENSQKNLPQIFWENLPKKKIRKITPLWKISSSRKS